VMTTGNGANDGINESLVLDEEGGRQHGEPDGSTARPAVG
jgi:hypothetical protein